MLKRLLSEALKPFRRLLAVVVVFQAIQAVAGLLLPTLNADIIDKGVARGDTGYIGRLGLVMLGVSFIQVFFSVLAVRWGARIAMGFGRDLRASLFHQVNSFSARELNRFGSPSLITRITNDVQQVQMLVLMTCTMLLAAPFTAVAGVALAIHEDAGLSWIIVVAIPVVVVLLANIIGRMVPNFRVMQEKVDRINEILREQLTGIRVVRAFVREPEEIERFRSANSSLTSTALRGGRLQGLMFPTVTLVVNASCVAVVWVGAYRVEDGSTQIGSLLAFLTYLIQILMAVLMSTFMAALWPRASASAERIVEVLDTETSVVVAPDARTTVDERATLEFRHVGFSYPGAAEPVLRDVSFRVGPGETLAIIGSTGSGKTTLVNLIPRLVDATAGSVVVDGVDVRQLAPEVIWSRVGLVPQKPFLFSGTVASNLRYGRSDATEAEMWEALEIAQAADFVAQMPGGLDAPITQGGANVSGGQRQRLSIARAVIRRPEFYVFDDAFSALDLATDARLRSALAPVTRDSVMIVVAQRVSTIRHADHILVLEDGEVMGLGTHDELLATCPTYQEIVQSQYSEESVA
ncbi:MAG: multidrug ABC transporter ATP-binding protein [Acidimicrobiales bacterium mtb01]|nr:ABC transporter ATP-binding protein [Actinomycetota bacterium]TEX45927.1 MAG: multidrug ABC transporter ATP-binding protein [Acidimicrobiales bacterium mtb01]